MPQEQVEHLNVGLIPAAQAVTLPGLFERRCERTPRAEVWVANLRSIGHWDLK